MLVQVDPREIKHLEHLQKAASAALDTLVSFGKQFNLTAYGHELGTKMNDAIDTAARQTIMSVGQVDKAIGIHPFITASSYLVTAQMVLAETVRANETPAVTDVDRSITNITGGNV